MKSLTAVLRHVVTISLALGLGSAQAAVSFDESPGEDFLIHGFVEPEFNNHLFDVTGPPTLYDATIKDLEIPVASTFLGLFIFDPQGHPLGSAQAGTGGSPPGFFSFIAAAGRNYVAQVLAIGGPFQGIQAGDWKIQITEHQVPIPEPAVWLMMAGGIALLGWLRVRKSTHLA